MKFSKVDQVIYSSAPISVKNLKPLAQKRFEISCTQDFQILFSKGNNSEKGHNSDMKKIRVNFFMRNVHMKFQNRSINGSKVNRRTHRHTDRHTDRQAESKMPFQLFQSWGHNETDILALWALSFNWNQTPLKGVLHCVVLIIKL